MAKLENRFIRIEDWKGNVYYPDSRSETSTVGIIFKEASNEPGSDPYTDAQSVSDVQANGAKSLMLSSTSDRKTLFKCSVTNIPFGKVVIGPRLKSSIATGDVSLVELNTYFRDSSGEVPEDTLLSTVNFTGKMFEEVSTFLTLPVGIEYKGTAIDSRSLIVELVVLPDTGATIWFDQMYVAMDIEKNNESGAYVDGSTVVFK